MAEPPAVTFGGLLRRLRLDAGLTQEELAHAASLSPRSVSDLERGINLTARKETARLLAAALGLAGQERSAFEAAARVGVTTGGASASGMAAVTRALPRDTAWFIDREPELRALTGAGGTASVMGIHAIVGMPGVGKTALAVHAAHLLRDQFADRQLFINLHAHTPGHDPVSPEAALAGLLAAVGVDARYLPDDLDGRTWLWRDKMAGQRALLVLDNAASTEQVTPLLPAGNGCLVLVTSRRYLGDMPWEVVPVLLDVLPPDEAQAMFGRLAPRVATEPGSAARELTRLAGYLPLAISLLARVYARHPSWTLAELTAETERSLLTLAAEKDSVAAAFEVSYRHLDSGQQQFFRRLGLHLGTTIDAYAAAALSGISVREAGGHLDALHGEGLLTEADHRRYGMHDLIRQYARDLAAGDPAADRDQVLNRLLDYYQQTAATAEARLARQSRTRPASGHMPSPPGAVPALPDRGRALSWARAERANLLACLDHVTRTDQPALVTALTAAISALLRRDGPWTDAITRHAIAARTARQVGDRLSEANALNDLGVVLQLTGDYRGAAQALEEALGIYRDLGDRLGQANVLSDLGFVRYLTDDYHGAAQALNEALGTHRDLGDRLGQANALRHLGYLRYLTDDYQGAAQALQEALGIYRDLGDRLGQANALNQLGDVRRQTGDYPGATRALGQALDICQDLGDRLGQANALNYLGAVRRQTGDYPGAAQALEHALDIYRNLGDRLGQANALNRLGTVRRQTGDYPGATQALDQALEICRDLGDRLGQANALKNLAAVQRVTGKLSHAAEALDAALGIYRGIGDRVGEVEALNELGTLHRVRGDTDQAQPAHQLALKLAREIGSSLDEANALAGLGRCALDTGRTTAAETSLRHAQEIFQRIGAAEASSIARELDAIARDR